MTGNLELSEVLGLAHALVAAFTRGNTAEYFAGFDASATFVFDFEQSIQTRAEYERSWQEYGAEVVSCESSNEQVRLLGTTALFLHDVRTVLVEDGVNVCHFQRETIVFARTSSGGVNAVHEHVSSLSAA
ncbi:conserved hypothetical protein [metagenome]|uniref:SnoaL-like domain-containing protein n=1 Tax=metagenome TaxID=256318 RepID=A0A2P2C4B9_9ZZZZ